MPSCLALLGATSCTSTPRKLNFQEHPILLSSSGDPQDLQILSRLNPLPYPPL